MNQTKQEIKNELLVTIIVLIIICLSFSTLLFFNWQTIVKNTLNLMENLISGLISSTILCLIAYFVLSWFQHILFEKEQLAKPNSMDHYFDIFKTSCYCFIELFKIFILIICTFVICITILVNTELSPHYFLVLSIVSTSLFVIVVNLSFSYIAMNRKFFKPSKKNIKTIYKKYDMQKIFSILSSIITIVVLGDTAATAAFTVSNPEDINNSFNEYIESPSYKILIPSLTVIVAYICVQINYGFNLINKDEGSSN
ncbi:hypothetical protein AEA09_07230 [Lysinibacillus contaminans]|uniref:Uncharacterized protein n=1 Tax=Lysinibacillus contaminans TaxID=1293441 RepID=A0ABR5K0D4_9BACI|nr:hypothetical protein [Lysinibacillus contaminans]KOS68368.1 hypothetical protein AEA09_07230 [Lysinibacillus contaminans]